MEHLDSLLHLGQRKSLKKKLFAQIDALAMLDQRLNTLEHNIRAFGITEEVLDLYNSDGSLAVMLQMNIPQLSDKTTDREQLSKDMLTQIKSAKEQIGKKAIGVEKSLVSTVKDLFGSFLKGISYYIKEVEKLGKYYNYADSTIDFNKALGMRFKIYHTATFANAYFDLSDLIDFINILYKCHPVDDWPKILAAIHALRKETGDTFVDGLPTNTDSLLRFEFTGFTLSDPNPRTLLDANFDTPKPYKDIGSMVGSLLHNAQSIEGSLKTIENFASRDTASARTEFVWKNMKFKYGIIFYFLDMHIQNTMPLARAFTAFITDLPKK